MLLGFSRGHRSSASVSRVIVSERSSEGRSWSMEPPEPDRRQNVFFFDSLDSLILCCCSESSSECHTPALSRECVAASWSCQTLRMAIPAFFKSLEILSRNSLKKLDVQKLKKSNFATRSRQANRNGGKRWQVEEVPRHSDVRSWPWQPMS